MKEAEHEPTRDEVALDRYLSLPKGAIVHYSTFVNTIVQEAVDIQLKEGKLARTELRDQHGKIKDYFIHSPFWEELANAQRK